MSIPQKGGGPIEDQRQLVASLEAGCKPRDQWRIGTEHEKFGFRLADLKPLSYEEPGGIRDLLEGLRSFGWEPVCEGETLVGLKQQGASVSLEPGGQLELSGAPLETLHQTCNEVHTHLHQVRQVCEGAGTGMIGLGASPVWSLDETPVMPKGRYGIMRRYMQRKGRLGLDMMFRTATIQVNLDFANEADMVRKFRVALALQPIATALFANSPFLDGTPNGFLSYRSHVWLDTDPDRTGMLPFVFEEGFGFEAYVDYVLDVPMYFIYRDGTYHDVSGKSFRDFLAGRLEGFEGQIPTLGDWADHLTTIFPEARLKTFLEMRGADGGPWGRICALPAFWVGLLYDDTALAAAWDLAKGWTAEERQALREAVPRLGFKASIGGRTVGEIAGQLLQISEAGLQARARLDSKGGDESSFLTPLRELVDAGKTPAEILLDRYQTAWEGDLSRIFS
ncbi:MAG: glutamate--cysteine ligase, partial [Pseudomonadota bacterium]